LPDLPPAAPSAPSAPIAADLLADTLQGLSTGVAWTTVDARLCRANPIACAWLGRGAGELEGASLFDLVEDFGLDDWSRLLHDPVGAQGLHRLTVAPSGGPRRTLGVRAAALVHGGQPLVALMMLPIEDRLQAESIEGLQREVLEAIALGRPLNAVLDLLCRRAESLAPGLACSVLLIEKNGTVTPAAGPSLPPAYVQALVGAPIGPRAGSCGTAAWRREAVEVTDIATDPLWADFKGLLPLLGMAACWSTPIIATNGEVVATFALYYPEKGSAPPYHRRMVEACVPLCRVAIQHEANRIEIERLAYFDPLTNLPNRRLFSDRARQALQLAARSHAAGALLLLDLDRFKTTNDSLGHGAGDEVLRETARRLQREVGESATVARLGGDEFVALLPRCGPVEAMHVAQRLRHALALPLRVAGMQIEVSTSVGISVFPPDGADLDRLLKNAEMAMYEAKRAGRGTARFFTSGMNDVIAQRLQMESALRQAVAARGLELHYQPKIALADGACTGVEALVRWTDPVLGAVPPDRFIALAEECGLVGAIDAWVLETACARLARWQRAGVAVPAVSVNVSPLRLHQDDVPAHVRRVLADNGLPPSALVLEVTERVMLSDDERVRADLLALHDMGVRLSVDDFGTGYSSLGYLKRLPVAELKIDRSFVADLERDESDRALASAVIGIGRALGLQVVAEGVETPGQRAILEQIGCDAVQGFLYTRALPADGLEAWLAGREAAAAAGVQAPHG
jgi:diguanylate cyclase (GGDEF)-like protein